MDQAPLAVADWRLGPRIAGTSERFGCFPVASQQDTPPKDNPPMVISIAHLTPIVSIIAGILILIMPRLLNIIVALYLIFVGIMGLGLFR